MSATTDVTALRLQLRKVGFHPIPVEGKARRTWTVGRRSSTPPTPKSGSGPRPGTSQPAIDFYRPPLRALWRQVEAKETPGLIEELGEGRIFG